MSGICEGRVAVITGAGRGIGRGHALEFARQGAKVVVNDLDPEPEVVDAIRAAGGEAVVNTDDISEWEGAARLIATAVDAFGRIDVLVNNAGFLRDRMLVSMREEEWDAVIKVHLKGTFATSRFAAEYWRNRAKAGETNDARIINTSSVSGIYGNPGQTNYGAAKAGIAAFTIIAAQELARYGVTVNAIAPAALTRMTENLGMGQLDEEGKDRMSPRWIAPIATWLASAESANVTGRVFEASGQVLAVAEMWHRGPTVDPIEDPTQLGDVVRDLMAKAQPNSDMSGQPATGPGRPTPY